MKRHSHLTKLAALTLICSLSMLGNLAAQAPVPPGAKVKGLVDFDHQYLRGREAKVEVNLKGGLISLAARAIVSEAPPLAELIDMIDGIYIRVYADDRSMSDPKDLFKHYESKFKAENWEVIAKVKGDDGELVQVMMLSTPQIVYGLCATVWDDGELVLVNIVGEIDLEMAGELLEHVDLVELMHGDLNLQRLMHGEDMEERYEHDEEYDEEHHREHDEDYGERHHEEREEEREREDR